jgi:hypothetical protein
LARCAAGTPGRRPAPTRGWGQRDDLVAEWGRLSYGLIRVTNANSIRRYFYRPAVSWSCSYIQTESIPSAYAISTLMTRTHIGMCGYRVTCAAPPTRPFPRPGRGRQAAGQSPVGSEVSWTLGFANCPLFRNNDRIGSELRAARVELGVLGGSQPSRCCGSQKWEPTCSDVPRPSAT